MEIESTTLAAGITLLALAGGGGFVALRWRDIRARSDRRKLLEQVGSALSFKPTGRHGEAGPTSVVPGVVLHSSWEGSLNGRPVRLGAGEREGRSVLEAEVSIPEGIAGGMALVQQYHDAFLQRMAGTKVQDVITGDAIFDDKMALRAAQGHLVRGLVNHTVRQRLLSLGEQCWLLAVLPQKAIMVWREDPERSLVAARKVEHLRALMEVLDQLLEKREPFERLAQIVQSDPDSWVRRRAVEALARRFQSHSGLEQALRDAMQDKDWLVRLSAARALGPSALEAFAHMLHVAPRPWPEFIITAVAELNNPAFLPVLRSALSTSIPAVLAVGRLKDVESAGRLIKCYDLAASAEHKQAILEVLEQLGALEAQPLLLREVMEPELAPSLRQAAVQALGTCGDERALEVLTPLTRVVVGGGLRSVALQTVAQLQARAGLEEGDWASTREQVRNPEPVDHIGLPLSVRSEGQRMRSSADEAFALMHGAGGQSLGEAQSELVPSESTFRRSLEAEAYDAGLQSYPYSREAEVEPDSTSASEAASGPAVFPPGLEARAAGEPSPDPLEAAGAQARFENHPEARSEARAEPRSDSALKQALQWMDDDPLFPPAGHRGPR